MVAPPIQSDGPSPAKSKIRLCMPTGVETGDKWDEVLDLFKTGSININFYNNVIGYSAGECVSGTIDIVLTEALNCQNLTLEFVGLERCNLSLDGIIKPMEYHRDAKEILRLVCMVVEFQSPVQPGHYSYPFMLYLPSWLPESLSLKVGKE